MIINDWKNFKNELSKLIARAWLDNQYREDFISDPRGQMLQEGLTLPDDIQIQIDEFSYRWSIEPSPDFTVLIFKIGLPPNPYSLQLQEEQLRVAQDRGFEDLLDVLDVSIWCF